MSTFAKEVLPVNIEEEMKQSYMDYAMSVIIGRALPDVRDGLKPVHRRVLYAMSELGLDWNKPYKKSARVVGDVIGKYHPHGDSAVYDAIVRMAQPFSLRYMLVDGQGNFGSIDGDAPAAMRYTEVRMARITHELLADIDKETVDFIPNYDETEREPAVFPARFPNLLVNGAAGIAVGLATNIPPHNLTEIINACVALIDDPKLDITGLMKHVPGPDFPTAAIINGSKGIREAYETGRGRVYVRARTHFEAHRTQPDRQSIIVTELPYQVNKAALLEKIAELVREKRVEGITELRDESDKSGMRIVIELRRGEPAEVVLNNLYQHTQLQNVFGINMVALMDGQPRLLNLKDIIEAFIRHRREVVTRRTLFDLRKSRERAHILEGLAVALANIDPIIAMIKAAASPAEAKGALIRKAWSPGVVVEMLKRAGETVSRPDGLAPELGLKSDGYHLSEVQAQAILDLRLHRLTGLEQDKITSEYKELIGKIEELLKILSSPELLMGVIRNELLQVREQYGDARRTEIVIELQELNPEDLITEEEVVVTFSHSGYVKTQPLTLYRAQRRGGRGKAAATVKEEDFIDRLFVASTHDTILCFSSHGKVYWLKAYDLPQGSRVSRGRPILNLLPLAEGERINTILPIREYEEGKFIFMATNQAVVKKTPLSAFSRPRSSGLIAIELQQAEYLIGVAVTDGSQDVMLFSSAGKSIRFNESEVRPMGRNARGVRGIQVASGEQVISLIICADGDVLTSTENGFGKRTPVDEYPVQGRGGKGVISIKTSERNGAVIGACLVNDDDEIMLITDSGTLIRTPVEGISSMGRNTQGVKLIALDEGQRLAGVEMIQSLGEAAANGDADAEMDIDEDTE
jgi:DNA gyrase subunit A